MALVSDKRNLDNIFGHERIIIEKVFPQIDEGAFPIKRVVGENVIVRSHVFSDGHDEILVVLLYKKENEEEWKEVPMVPKGNDVFKGSFSIEEQADYVYTVRGYVNDFATWRRDLEKKLAAGQDVAVDLKAGAKLVEATLKRASVDVQKKLEDSYKILKGSEKIKEAIDVALSEELFKDMESQLDVKRSVLYERKLKVSVDRKLASFSSWYEFFPRSWSGKSSKHGTFKDCERIFPEIKKMGFDVIYLPPIHPIGKTNRKGKNNSVKCKPDDPGCPWAIGSKEGGHKDIHQKLGTLSDFKHFIAKAKSHDLEVALDLAFQCSPDHPYVKEHPQWFKWRPDGTVQFAENPPKKYEDVLPINFETEDWKNLWEELKSIVVYWVDQGVKIFRVDNPHTKPFVFWEWLISGIKEDYPDVIFLAEAFTRPKVMYRLAKAGFCQSYTYFTWRYTKHEFIDYMKELANTEVAEFFRPNFWPNTPDILPEHLQYGGRPAFIMRAVLAATLSSNYGIFGPAFELCVTEAIEGKEEYLNSEKYEIKKWDWKKKGHLKDIIARLNKIRKENEALQITRNIRFLDVDNDNILAFYKATSDHSNIVLVAVNLDTYHRQSGWFRIPIDELGIEHNRPFMAHDLLSGDKYIWQGDCNYIELDPQYSPAHIIRIRCHMHREQDFDYFM